MPAMTTLVRASKHFCILSVLQLAPSILCGETRSETFFWPKPGPNVDLIWDASNKVSYNVVVTDRGNIIKITYSVNGRYDTWFFDDDSPIVGNSIDWISYRDHSSLWIMSRLGRIMNGCSLLDLERKIPIAHYQGSSFDLSPDRQHVAWFADPNVQGEDDYLAFVDDIMVFPIVAARSSVKPDDDLIDGRAQGDFFLEGRFVYPNAGWNKNSRSVSILSSNQSLTEDQHPPEKWELRTVQFQETSSKPLKVAEIKIQDKSLPKNLSLYEALGHLSKDIQKSAPGWIKR